MINITKIMGFQKELDGSTVYIRSYFVNKAIVYHKFKKENKDN